MQIKIKSYSSQSSLISSILFFILGAVLFTSADKVINTASKIVGIIFAIISIISLTIYIIQSRNKQGNTGNLIFGLTTLTLAFIFIFCSSIVEKAIRLIIGAWILLTGITRLINVLSMNKKYIKFYELLIVAIILIIIGTYTIVVGDVILTSVGLIMMIYAAVEIIGYVLYSKDTIKPEEPGTTTLIVPEETPKEEKRKKKNDIIIKDVKEKKKRKKEK